MEKDTMGNGDKIKSKVQVCGRVSKEIAMWENGRWANPTGLEYIGGWMETDTKVNFSKAWSMDKG